LITTIIAGKGIIKSNAEEIEAFRIRAQKRSKSNIVRPL
jgi:hypothetical protein